MNKYIKRRKEKKILNQKKLCGKEKVGKKSHVRLVTIMYSCITVRQRWVHNVYLNVRQRDKDLVFEISGTKGQHYQALAVSNPDVFRDENNGTADERSLVVVNTSVVLPVRHPRLIYVPGGVSRQHPSVRWLRTGLLSASLPAFFLWVPVCRVPVCRLFFYECQFAEGRSADFESLVLASLPTKLTKNTQNPTPRSSCRQLESLFTGVEKPLKS